MFNFKLIDLINLNKKKQIKVYQQFDGKVLSVLMINFLWYTWNSTQ